MDHADPTSDQPIIENKNAPWELVAHWSYQFLQSIDDRLKAHHDDIAPN